MAMEAEQKATAFYNDAGVGVDDAGLARLAVLDEQGIPAATVDAATARIGDGRSTYRDGLLSCVNAAADALGMMKVGPESAGSEPGPACYGRGGVAPTVTDADLVLGYLDPEYFLGGAMRLEAPRAEASLAELGASLFAAGQNWAESRGLILVDTKYEMGLTPDGEVIVADEIHTPDSSRYWYRDTYEQAMSQERDPQALDKEYVRRWLAEENDYLGDGDPPALTDEVRCEAARRYI